MYPLKFIPYLKEFVWGGERIAPYKEIASEQHNIGESWELSGVEGHESVVANGALAGRTITDIVREFKGRLVGEKVYAATGDEFPLLIKFIDAKRDLSIQVHPNDELALAKHGPGAKGKTEMWYVVKADEGARLMSGLKKSITPDEYVSLVQNDKITDVLCSYELHPGDVFFLPAGRIHAIGAGAFITEIQQTSDFTYRIYDYGRLGLDGKPRPLHIDLAKEAIDYNVYSDYRTRYERKENEEVQLVDCKYFTTSVYEVSETVRKDLSGIDSFMVVICMEGRGTVIDAECEGGPTKGHPIDIHQGETVLIPATSREVSFVPEEGSSMKILTSYIR